MRLDKPDEHPAESVSGEPPTKKWWNGGPLPMVVDPKEMSEEYAKALYKEPPRTEPPCGEPEADASYDFFDAGSRPSAPAPRVTMAIGNDLAPTDTCVVCREINTPFRLGGKPTCTRCMGLAGSRPSAPSREGLCDDCGNEYPTPWFVSNDIWNQVVELSADPKNFLCMHCFVKRADKVIRCTGWEIVPENRPSAPAPSGEPPALECCRRQFENILYCLDRHPDMLASMRAYAETGKSLCERKLAESSPVDPARSILAKCEQYWNESNICDAEIHAVLEFIHTEARKLLESSPVDLQQEAEKWWAENWNRFGESRSRVDVPKALAAFAAHLRGK